MSRLAQTPEIMRMASELGLDGRDDPVEQIIAYCQQRIQGWLRESDVSVWSVSQLETLVTTRLRLVFEIIRTDEDLTAVIRKYIGLGEHVFASLKHQLDAHTFAALLERRSITAAAIDRYVAVIDARGDKAARVFFTKWHEIAHLLTLIRQLELPFHRSTTQRDPLERLMDTIAAEVGFYGPILYPALAAELKASGRLSFALVDRIRQQCFPEASFQATLNACAAKAAVPAVVVEARMAYTKSESKEITSPQLTLISLPKPQAQLRAVTAISNAAARKAGFRIDQNMHVPESSLIYKHFADESLKGSAGDCIGTESLGDWRHSDGIAIGAGRIVVETRKVKGSVLAIVQPA